MSTEHYRNLRGERVHNGDVIAPLSPFGQEDMTEARVVEAVEAGKRIACGSLRLALIARRILSSARSVDYVPELPPDTWEIRG